MHKIKNDSKHRPGAEGQNLVDALLIRSPETSDTHLGLDFS